MVLDFIVVIKFWVGFYECVNEVVCYLGIV